VHVDAARYLGQKHVPFLAGGRREEDLAQNRSNRRLTVVRGDVGDPALDCVQARRRDAGHGAGIVCAEEDGAAVGVREGNQLTREVLVVGGQDPAVAEAEGLELGPTVLSGAELVQNPISRVEHRGHVRVDVLSGLPGRASSRGAIRDYDKGHPTSAVLVVEVSNESLRYDRTVKQRPYARCGIPEYWILVLPEARLEVYRGRPETATRASPTMHPETRSRRSLAPTHGSSSTICFLDSGESRTSRGSCGRLPRRDRDQRPNVQATLERRPGRRHGAFPGQLPHTGRRHREDRDEASNARSCQQARRSRPDSPAGMEVSAVLLVRARKN